MAGVGGGAATLLLHSLFFAAAIWSGGMSPRFPDRPDAIGAGANSGKPEGDSSERRMTVRILSQAIASTQKAPTDALLQEALRISATLDITGPDALPLPPLNIEQGGLQAESTDAELIARAKLTGIYESQMRARIERAWTLPVDLLPEQTFNCRALIRQHSDGRVSEVELPYSECEGTPALRQSLINAIFSASPLPGPPHPGVFVDSFSLMFRSEAVRRKSR